jgi:uncharacterized repeat protein (TIGR03803 family)
LDGLVFKLDTSNNLSVLYNFCSLPNCADGQGPDFGLVRDDSGNLYGVTAFGGAFGTGTVFELTPEGVETVLHSFAGPDGLVPACTLAQDKKGNLYGIAESGGANAPDLGPGGALFKQPEAGGAETVLYSFCSLANCADGYNPLGQEVQIDKSGNFYGLALGGVNGYGVAWKIDKRGKETVIHNFAQGDSIYSGLTIDSAGNLYGTTINGGVYHRGSVFKLSRHEEKVKP